MSEINVGGYNLLKVERKVDFGYYLKEGEQELLLPYNCILDESFNLGDEIKVFVFRDNQGRLVATQETPNGAVGEFAAMRVADVNKIGAFLDWGISKQLLVPYSEQGRKMNEGETHVVMVINDPQTDRVIGTSKFGSFLDREISKFTENQNVNLLVYSVTDLGYNCIVDGVSKGLLYKNEVFRSIQIGDTLDGFIKKVRTDGLLDLSLKKGGYIESDIERDAQQLLGLMISNDGVLYLHDKSSPEEIKRELSMSKKHFKKLVGFLLKKNLIETFSDKIVLK